MSSPVFEDEKEQVADLIETDFAYDEAQVRLHTYQVFHPPC
jgi:hypothetical protein